MNVTVNQILELAKKQIGTKEKPAGSNNVKYNTAYYGREVSGSAYPWCCVFIWWLFYTAGAPELFYGGKKTASCTTLMNYAKKNGLFVSDDYRPGDLIFYNWHGKKSEADHIGICVSTYKGGVVCVEGNTSVTSNDNGGNVMQRTRDLSVVVGAYRPKYYAGAGLIPDTGSSATSGTSTAKTENVTVSLPVLKQGMKISTVKTLQILLNGRGCNCGAVDGSFGPATLSAVKSYQKAKGLTVDGSVGPATWKSLLA